MRPSSDLSAAPSSVERLRDVETFSDPIRPLMAPDARLTRQPRVLTPPTLRAAAGGGTLAVLSRHSGSGLMPSGVSPLGPGDHDRLTAADTAVDDKRSFERERPTRADVRSRVPDFSAADTPLAALLVDPRHATQGFAHRAGLPRSSGRRTGFGQ